ncbi:MAG TPA: YihA family ribosome biogenesis GTP-binding protein, partial [Rhodopila sp.]
MVDPTQDEAGEALARPHLIPGDGTHLTEDEYAAALEAGRLLFAAECQFFFGAQKLDQLPPERGTEIA